MIWGSRFIRYRICPVGSAPEGEGPPRTFARRAGSFAVVALDRSSDGPSREFSSARVEPHQAGTGRYAVGVDRYGRGELTRDGDGLDTLFGDARSSQEPARRFADERPPQFRILRRAAVTRVRRLHRVEFVVENLAVEAHESDLRSARSQVDTETEFVAHAGGIEACWSIMSAITARMNSSASALMPPATPP